MDITVNYKPTVKELARSSLLFAEKRPIMMFLVGIINAIAWILLGIMTLYFIVFFKLNLSQLFIIVTMLTWLFGRKRFFGWILKRRMEKSLIVDQPITINITRNGIAWHGSKIRPNSINWEDLKYIIEAGNGYILPHSYNKFLWIPHRGFETPDQLVEFAKYLGIRQTVMRSYLKWLC